MTLNPTKPKRIAITGQQRAALRAQHHLKPYLSNIALRDWFNTTHSRAIDASIVSRSLSGKYAYLDDNPSTFHLQKTKHRAEHWPEPENKASDKEEGQELEIQPQVSVVDALEALFVVRLYFEQSYTSDLPALQMLQRLERSLERKKFDSQH